MACINPDIKRGALCKLGAESHKRLCVKCKHGVSNEEADRIRKTQKYNAKIRARQA